MVEINAFKQTFQPANALRAREEHQMLQDQNARAEAQSGRLQETHDYNVEQRPTKENLADVGALYKAYDMATRVDDPRQAQAVLDSLLPLKFKDKKLKIRRTGKEVEYDLPDGTTVKAPAIIMSEMFAAMQKNPEWSFDKNFQKHMQAYMANHPGISVTQKTENKGKGTEVERQAAKHGMSVPDYRLTLKKKLQIGMTDDDKRAYDIQDDRAYRAENEIRKLKNDLSMWPEAKKGQDELTQVKAKKTLLKDYERLLKRHEAKRQAILNKYSGKGKKTGEIKVPQETIDYWKERGKTLEEIQEAFAKKFKDNIPKIGY